MTSGRPQRTRNSAPHLLWGIGSLIEVCLSFPAADTRKGRPLEGSENGPAVPIGGERSWTGATPFFASMIGTAVLRNLHLSSTPWEGRSRPKYPCGNARRKTTKEMLRSERVSAGL